MSQIIPLLNIRAIFWEIIKIRQSGYFGLAECSTRLGYIIYIINRDAYILGEGI